MSKILIIEDEYGTREQIAEILELHNFETAKACNGMTGLEVARTFKPDLILCDIDMPDLNGRQVLQKLREDADLRLIPFIFLTGLSEMVHLRTGMNLGADDYLTKPFSIDVILNAIAARLQRSQDFKNPEFFYECELVNKLTERQREVLQMVAKGKTTKEIAKQLGISPKTVETHRSDLMNRLDIHELSGLIIFSLRVGLIDLNQD